MAAPKLDPARLLEATGMGVRPLARRLDLDPAVLCRGLSPWQAEKYAMAVGHMPEWVWGLDGWFAGVDDDDHYDPDDELTDEEFAARWPTLAATAREWGEDRDL